jgi:phage tail sheath protein FI
MPQYLSPGVYIEELPGPQSIQGVGTNTVGMVGVTRRGPERGKPVLVTSFGEFTATFGSYFSIGAGGAVDVTPDIEAQWVFDPSRGGRWWLFPYAVQGFFDNGGQRLFVKRVVAAGAAAATASSRTMIIGELSPTDGRFALVAPPPAAPALQDPVIVQISASARGSWANGRLKANLYPVAAKRFRADGTRLAGQLGSRLEAGDNADVPVRGGITADTAVLVRVDDETVTGTFDPLTSRVAFSGLQRAYNAGTAVEVFCDAAVQPAGGPVPPGRVRVRLEGWPAEKVAADPPFDLGALALIQPLEDGPAVRAIVAGIDATTAVVELDAVGGAALPTVHADSQIVLVKAALEVEYLDPDTDEQASEPLFGPAGLQAGDDPELSDLVEQNSALVELDVTGTALDWDHFPALATDDGGPVELGGGTDDYDTLDAQAFVGVDGGSGRRTGIRALEDIDEIAIVAAPGIWSTEVQNGLINQCAELKDRFAILDPRDRLSVQQVMAFREPLDTNYAALYHPWIQMRDVTTRRPLDVPPSGHIAGVYVRSDDERGVHKAPANEVVRSIIGLSDDINKREQDLLNPIGINALRSFPNRGFRVWGSRTLSSIPEWRYVPVRRLFIFIEESIKQGTSWVVFEPNGPDLWARVRQAVTNFLNTQWRAGALLGASQDEAFFVTCDRSTMSQDDLDNGRLIIEVGIAPIRPAEFVIFRFRQKTLDQRAA